jgi:DNA-binding transcriptional regulator YiaG
MSVLPMPEDADVPSRPDEEYRRPAGALSHRWGGRARPPLSLLISGGPAASGARWLTGPIKTDGPGNALLASGRPSEMLAPPPRLGERQSRRLVSHKTTELRLSAVGMSAVPTYAEASLVELPILSNNLVEDVRKVCGLSNGELGRVMKVSAGTISRWKRTGVPSKDSKRLLEQLRAVGLILVGGLGVSGVHTWLTVGGRSRLRRIRAGEINAVVAEARSYEE